MNLVSPTHQDISFIERVILPYLREIGAEVLLEPEFKYVGCIRFKNGKTHYFRNPKLSINPAGSGDIAQDKGYTKFFLTQYGFPTPQSLVFFRPDWQEKVHCKRGVEDAIEWAKQCGFPCFVKPNNDSEGDGVFRVCSPDGILRAVQEIFKTNKVAIIEQAFTGTDVRVTVFQGKVEFACIRTPLAVIGDGVHTITELFTQKKSALANQKREIYVEISDPRITEKLEQLNLAPSYIPKINERVELLANANLSTGGDTVNITDTLHPFFKQVAVDIATKMNLILAGIDMIIDGDIAHKTDRFTILEINATPGMKHFASLGTTERDIVRTIYRKAIDVLEKSTENTIS